MNQMYIERAQQAGFFGGTLTGVVANLSAADVISTIILSAIGAVVSFGVSYQMRRIFNRRSNGKAGTTGSTEGADDVSDEDTEANGP